MRWTFRSFIRNELKTANNKIHLACTLKVCRAWNNGAYVVITYFLTCAIGILSIHVSGNIWKLCCSLRKLWIMVNEQFVWNNIVIFARPLFLLSRYIRAYSTLSTYMYICIVLHVYIHFMYTHKCISCFVFTNCSTSRPPRKQIYMPSFVEIGPPNLM